MQHLFRQLLRPLGASLLGALLGVLLLALPAPALAQLHAHPDENGTPVVRSLESLRDLDYQSWQVVAYREGPPGGPLKLRIVGYPGKVRLDHPTALQALRACDFTPYSGPGFDLLPTGPSLSISACHTF
jgi:hypothetical protein